MGDANNWKNLTGALAVMATVAEYMENLAQVERNPGSNLVRSLACQGGL